MTALLRRDVALAALNTLALPATARLFADAVTPQAALQAAQQAALETPRRFILGGGSNLVWRGDFDGLVLHSAIAGRRLAGEDSKAYYVQAGAGENWHEFVLWTLQQGLPGLENLVLIPGTVGAAPIQNIGAYGLEVAERFQQLEALDLDSGETRVFDRAACGFAYRDSVFKREGWHLDGRLLITSVTFRLPKKWLPRFDYADLARELQSLEVPTANDIAEAVTAIRRRKLPDPAQIPNAGSFFKNPVFDAAAADRLAAAHPGLPCYPQPDGTVKLAAGWMIEQAGWKGRSLGPVAAYEKQALVLVNRGGANGADVLACAQAIQEAVQQRFAVWLEIEPVVC